MSAAAIAAMTICLEEDRRRREGLEPLVSVADIPAWAGVVVCTIIIGWAVLMMLTVIL